MNFGEGMFVEHRPIPRIIYDIFCRTFATATSSHDGASTIPTTAAEALNTEQEVSGCVLNILIVGGDDINNDVVGARGVGGVQRGVHHGYVYNIAVRPKLLWKIPFFFANEAYENNFLKV